MERKGLGGHLLKGYATISRPTFGTTVWLIEHNLRNLTKPDLLALAACPKSVSAYTSVTAGSEGQVTATPVLFDKLSDVDL